MSLWIPRRDKNGRLYFFVVGLPIVLIPLVFVIPLCLCLLTFCVVTAPVETMLSFLAVTGFGFLLFAVAKVSVFRQGRLVSFGSAKMNSQMRTAYRTGWVLMVIGATLTLFAISFASRMHTGL